MMLYLIKIYVDVNLELTKEQKEEVIGVIYTACNSLENTLSGDRGIFCKLDDLE